MIFNIKNFVTDKKFQVALRFVQNSKFKIWERCTYVCIGTVKKITKTVISILTTIIKYILHNRND